MKKSIGKVTHPRHFLLYRALTGGPVEIGRALHDGMDLKRHLPDEYGAGPDKPGARNGSVMGIRESYLRGSALLDDKS